MSSIIQHSLVTKFARNTLTKLNSPGTIYCTRLLTFSHVYRANFVTKLLRFMFFALEKDETIHAPMSEGIWTYGSK